MDRIAVFSGSALRSRMLWVIIVLAQLSASALVPVADGGHAAAAGDRTTETSAHTDAPHSHECVGSADRSCPRFPAHDDCLLCRAIGTVAVHVPGPIFRVAAAPLVAGAPTDGTPLLSQGRRALPPARAPPTA
jgi:hypothetical protein